MKKVILILSLVMILVYAGCNDDPGTDENRNPGDTTHHPIDTSTIDTTTIH